MQATKNSVVMTENMFLLLYILFTYALAQSLKSYSLFFAEMFSRQLFNALIETQSKPRVKPRERPAHFFKHS